MCRASQRCVVKIQKLNFSVLCAAWQRIWTSCDRLSQVVWTTVSRSLQTTRRTLRHMPTSSEALRYH